MQVQKRTVIAAYNYGNDVVKIISRFRMKTVLHIHLRLIAPVRSLFNDLTGGHITVQFDPFGRRCILGGVGITFVNC